MMYFADYKTSTEFIEHGVLFYLPSSILFMIYDIKTSHKTFIYYLTKVFLGHIQFSSSASYVIRGGLSVPSFSFRTLHCTTDEQSWTKKDHE